MPTPRLLTLANLSRTSEVDSGKDMNMGYRRPVVYHSFGGHIFRELVIRERTKEIHLTLGLGLTGKTENKTLSQGRSDGSEGEEGGRRVSGPVGRERGDGV